MSDPMAEFSERMRAWSAMTMAPVPDMDRVLVAWRRNVEAMSAANKAALDGAQAVAKRHLEIVQQTLGEMTESVKTLSAAETPEAKAARQAELLKQAYERALANLREMSELIQHANAEAVGVLNGRFVEALDEVKGLMDK